MPDDYHPVADDGGSPVVARGADREEVHEHYVLAVLGQQIVQTLDVSDSSYALGALEDRTGVEFALQRLGQSPLHDSFRPSDVQITIGCVVHQIDDPGPRRPPSDFAEHRLTIGLAVPLHVGEPGTEAECWQHLAAHLTAAL